MFDVVMRRHSDVNLSSMSRFIRSHFGGNGLFLILLGGQMIEAEESSKSTIVCILFIVPLFSLV